MAEYHMFDHMFENLPSFAKTQQFSSQILVMSGSELNKNELVHVRSALVDDEMVSGIIKFKLLAK